jgi:hypothetical protein
MKRAGDDLSGRTSGSPTNTSSTSNVKAEVKAEDKPEVDAVEPVVHYDPRMKSRGGKIKPLTAVEMDTRLLLALTAESEQKNDNAIVKLGAVDWGHAYLPIELTIMIARLLSKPEDQANMALTCRQNYISVDTAFPLRRFPGLSSDLKRTCNGQLMARFEHIQAFDKHLKPDGNYDTALLTSLSPAVRLTMGLAMMIWSSSYTVKGDKEACKKLSLDRFKADFKALKEGSQKDELDESMALAVQRIQSAPAGKTNKMRSFSFGVEELKMIFESGLPDEEASLHLLSEMLLLPKHQASTIDYALQFIDKLPVHAVANLVILGNLNPLVLQDKLSKLTPAAQRLALEKIIAATNKNMNRLGENRSIDFMRNVVNIFSLVLSSSQSVQDEAQFTMLTELVRMLKKCIHTSMKKFIQDNPYFFSYSGPTALQDLAKGYAWKDANIGEKWAEFQKTAGVSGSEFMVMGYLHRLLHDEITQFPDAQTAPLLNELKQAFSFHSGAPNIMMANAAQ